MPRKHKEPHMMLCYVQVAIKKVLQDKRFKNRELQIMKMMSHPNVVSLKHCFYSTTEKEEVSQDVALQRVYVMRAAAIPFKAPSWCEAW